MKKTGLIIVLMLMTLCLFPRAVAETDKSLSVKYLENNGCWVDGLTVYFGEGFSHPEEKRYINECYFESYYDDGSVAEFVAIVDMTPEAIAGKDQITEMDFQQNGATYLTNFIANDDLYPGQLEEEVQWFTVLGYPAVEAVYLWNAENGDLFSVSNTIILKGNQLVLVQAGTEIAMGARGDDLASEIFRYLAEEQVQPEPTGQAAEEALTEDSEYAQFAAAYDDEDINLLKACGWSIPVPDDFRVESFNANTARAIRASDGAMFSINQGITERKKPMAILKELCKEDSGFDGTFLSTLENITLEQIPAIAGAYRSEKTDIIRFVLLPEDGRYIQIVFMEPRREHFIADKLLCLALRETKYTPGGVSEDLIRLAKQIDNMYDTYFQHYTDNGNRSLTTSVQDMVKLESVWDLFLKYNPKNYAEQTYKQRVQDALLEKKKLFENMQGAAIMGDGLNLFGKVLERGIGEVLGGY